MSSSSRDVAIFGLELPCRALVTVGKPESLGGGGGSSESSPPDFVHRFAVATASARNGNSINLLEYQEGRKVAECAAVFTHPYDVLHLEFSQRLNQYFGSDQTSSSSSKNNPENDRYLVATIHPASSSNSSNNSPLSAQQAKKLNLSGQRETSFWDLPDTEQEGLHEFRPIATLPLDAISVHFFKSPSTSSSDDDNGSPSISKIKAVVITRCGEVSIIKFIHGNTNSDGSSSYQSAEIEASFSLESAFVAVGLINPHKKHSSDIVITSCCWSSSNNNTNNDQSSSSSLTVFLGYMASMTAITSNLVKVEIPLSPSASSSPFNPLVTLISKNAHAGSIRKIVNSLGRLHTILSAGDDGFVKGWDVFPPLLSGGNSSSPSTSNNNLELFSFSAHNHFVYDISINEDHPELILTCGADRCTRLWRAPILSASNSPSSLAGSPTTATEGLGAASDAASTSSRLTIPPTTTTSNTNNNNNLVICVRSTTSNPHTFDKNANNNNNLVFGGSGSGVGGGNSTNNNTNVRDSVTSAQWSGTWVYASSSFEGGVHVDQVPFEMRSQLLLSM